MDSQPRQKFFLCVFYSSGIFQSLVHITIAMGIRDALDCTGGGFRQSNCAVNGVDHHNVKLLPLFLSLVRSFLCGLLFSFSFCLPGIDPLFHPTDEETCQSRRQPKGGNKQPGGTI